MQNRWSVSMFGGGGEDMEIMDDDFFEEITRGLSHSCTHTDHKCDPSSSGLAMEEEEEQNRVRESSSWELQKLIMAAELCNGRGPSSDEAIWNSKKKKKQRGCLGKKNIEAVRKYRLKKKAEAAVLEEQVLHLRALNENLAMKLNNHESLEAEVCRLRQMVAEFGGRIDLELGMMDATRIFIDGAFPSSEQGHGCGRQQKQVQEESDEGGLHLIMKPADDGVICAESCRVLCRRRRYCEYDSHPHGPSTPNDGRGASLVIQEAAAGLVVSCEEEEEEEGTMDATNHL